MKTFRFLFACKYILKTSRACRTGCTHNSCTSTKQECSNTDFDGFVWCPNLSWFRDMSASEDPP